MASFPSQLATILFSKIFFISKYCSKEFLLTGLSIIFHTLFIAFAIIENSLRPFRVCAKILLPAACAVGAFERKQRQRPRRKEVDHAFVHIFERSDPCWLSEYC